MNSERIGSPKRSGNEPLVQAAEEHEKALLRSLTEKARKHSISFDETQQLVILLAMRLAKVLGQPQDSSRFAAYSERLADLEGSVLLAVFERAEKELRFFPPPSELREMAGVLTAQSELIEIDRAWMWVTNYIAKHGVEGREYIESEAIQGECPKCQGTRWIRTEVQVERNDKPIVTREATRCDCRRVTLREQAPQIPPRLQATLRCLAPSLSLALEAIRDCDARWASRRREEFNEAYRRAARVSEAA